ncbi:DUF664 domain-containing protein [Paenibacillus albiflavus]|uniref:DUF664 domain-containing protein n=1 Tax=Paenibacillus albiflavus TaxID=2545760 RepID=A0A4R4ENE6_9BACL|nr:DinB family protein [Paenibacillus albiflavus]TCZ80950.1 DUF664 domain-containing protein [Paenibacillus albiflavus]
MKHLFKYNWQIREEWILLLEQLDSEELMKERVGGVGSFLRTIFHIVDVEYSWVCAMMGKPVEDPDFADYQTLEAVRELSKQYHNEIADYINNWTGDQDHDQVIVPWSGETMALGEIVRHVVAHEIHHIGQLSVWARELGIKPVDPNFIHRNLLS